MTFDEQVAALRGKVEPKPFNRPKSEATPEQWAARLGHLAALKAANPEAHRRSSREAERRWRAAHPEAVRDRRRRRREADPESARRAPREYRRRRRGGDFDFRLRCNLRARLCSAVRRPSKSGSAVRDLGCSIEELKAHIERQWIGCMSWENWGSGSGKWQIDHIFPLAKADLTQRVQLLACCNWQNLQPLWFEDNVRKGDAVTPEAQQLFDGLVSQFQKEEVRDGSR
jgi:hypothetical protein